MGSYDHVRVRDLFQQAIALADQHRNDFVASLVEEDSLVVAQLRRLLSFHDPGTRILETELSAELNSDSLASHARNTRELMHTTASDRERSEGGRLETGQWTGDRPAKEPFVLAAGIVAVIALLVAVGVWAHDALQSAVSDSLQRSMQSLLDEQAAAVRIWLDAEKRVVESWSCAPQVTTHINQLNGLAENPNSLNRRLRESEATKALASAMTALTEDIGGYEYAVWNREGTLIADSNILHSDMLGHGATESGAALLSRVFRGETVLWLSNASGSMTADPRETRRTTGPGIAVITPVRGSDQRPVAALLITSDELQRRLEKLLQQARCNDTGQCYAFDANGILLTEVRDSAWLAAARRLDTANDFSSARILRAGDPGGNLLSGYSPARDRRTWPLIRSVSSAVAGIDGADFDGYPDYRGVTVVGVWTWIPEYRIGIAMELDKARAFSPLSPLNRAFVVILFTLVMFAVGCTVVVIALLRSRRRSALGRIGAYTLNHLLGEGGFAHVYHASHALLKRPTAVKILKRNQMNEKNLVRFEREVQLASSLTHPNTIGIYDYGLAADGRFYYAMEYVPGLSLEELVHADGPQPPERIAWILIQVCRSLREAHTRGLIHRDIKPQNVMLCNRGGEDDTVKVLDFGLARNVDASGGSRITETQLLIGTPHYIAPERILDPACMDPRSDIYSLGILGYYLLTGREPFDAADSIDALAQTIHGQAQRPSERSPGPIPDSLDRLICDCHSRAITDRPASIDAVLGRLEQIRFPKEWNKERAKLWWNQFRASEQFPHGDEGQSTSDLTTCVLPTSEP